MPPYAGCIGLIRRRSVGHEIGDGRTEGAFRRHGRDAGWLVALVRFNPSIDRRITGPRAGPAAGLPLARARPLTAAWRGREPRPPRTRPGTPSVRRAIDIPRRRRRRRRSGHLTPGHLPPTESASRTSASWLSLALRVIIS